MKKEWKEPKLNVLDVEQTFGGRPGHGGGGKPGHGVGDS